jgi:hypothetical protein
MVCTHDLGPGTKVCLRCRQEQREADRARQQRLLVKVGVVGLGLVFAYVAAASVASAVRGASAASRTAEVPTMLATTEVVQQGTHRPADAPRTERAPIASHIEVPAPFSIIVPNGRTDAPDDLILERTGDSVVVDFDTDAARTRRRDKFERIVRQTLPLVYGQRVETVLDAIPAGALANEGDLVMELPVRGVHVPLADGWTIDLFPETRAGRDGPLVVSYRTRLRKI